MRDQSEQSKQITPFWVRAAEWVKGPLLGGSVIMLVTPLLKWTNYVYKGERMPRGHYFSGAAAYGVSAVPGYAATFLFKGLLKRKQEDTSGSYELITSFVAGGISGLVCTPFEAVAQNKQLAKVLSTAQTVQQMHKFNGYGSFFQGGGSAMLREGMWSTVYMTAIPMVSSILQKRGAEKKYADMMAMLFVAGTYGFVSSPLNQLRFRKQDNLIVASVPKSYLQHIKDIFNQEPNASVMKRVATFFKAGVPRFITTTVAAGLIVTGSEYYDKGLEYIKPNEPV
ncbi:Mitochondrial carrier protein (plasmid) [Legionella adelaidensis]|uniref:Mitochondrial carrier protein n=1 Tax=Legionella adelaidensis TaxID=45056 RepID=A0A0W0R2I5_9GAMM|nr:MC/SLC25 family protein [Legionella adelaidensis]KTC65313.1 hypothetical protein Lade_1335 [Legionella adelaidensis]VEH86036.1 Mitochondrial carrier protein [Legionella adelaidensis]